MFGVIICLLLFILFGLRHLIIDLSDKWISYSAVT